MPVTHVNRKRQTYFLHEGKTKTGKPKYFFSKDSAGTLLDAVPDGFEIYENPNAQVFLRKAVPEIITAEEVVAVQIGLQKFAPFQNCIVDVKGEHVVVCKARGGCYQQVLRFTLRDETTRRFFVDRWWFRGSNDDWFPLGVGKLPMLVEDYCWHLRQESFFELM